MKLLKNNLKINKSKKCFENNSIFRKNDLKLTSQKYVYY